MGPFASSMLGNMGVPPEDGLARWNTREEESESPQIEHAAGKQSWSADGTAAGLDRTGMSPVVLVNFPFYFCMSISHCLLTA